MNFTDRSKSYMSTEWKETRRDAASDGVAGFQIKCKNHSTVKSWSHPLSEPCIQ